MLGRRTVVFGERGLGGGVHHGPLAGLVDGAGELRDRLRLLHLHALLFRVFSHAALLGRACNTRWPSDTGHFPLLSSVRVYHLPDQSKLHSKWEHACLLGS